MVLSIQSKISPLVIELCLNLKIVIIYSPCPSFCVGPQKEKFENKCLCSLYSIMSMVGNQLQGLKKHAKGWKHKTLWLIQYILYAVYVFWRHVIGFWLVCKRSASWPVLKMPEIPVDLGCLISEWPACQVVFISQNSIWSFRSFDNIFY